MTSNSISSTASSTLLSAAPAYNNDLVATYNTRTPSLQVLVGTQTVKDCNIEVDINVVGSASSSVAPATDVANWYKTNSAYITA